MDITALTIDYASALQMADEAGGAAYKSGHTSCFQRVVLANNQWNFEYMEDRWGASDDHLRLCFDGVTGEPCEFFYEDASSDNENN